MSRDTPIAAPLSLIGQSEAMCAVRDVAERVASGDAKVLITGESGVGKDVVARYIHARSMRAARPFVTVNCAAIPETLLESELFGHVRGSFTGAYRDKVGRFQLAHRGTVFLDELGETSPRMQALLLRFLESGEVCPVGSHTVSATVDVRVIAATNRELETMVAAGQFREDLLYRIRVVHLRVPPLRERMKDFRPLVDHLLQRLGKSLAFTDEAFDRLLRYHWPGNVRELLNVLEQVSWLAGDVVQVRDLPDVFRPAAKQSTRERAGRVADELYRGLTAGQLVFWDDVYTRFLQRDLTRDDLRALIRLGLERTGGNYRAMLPLLGLSSKDYKRLLNFLAAHDCVLDFRSFRSGRDVSSARSSV